MSIRGRGSALTVVPRSTWLALPGVAAVVSAMTGHPLAWLVAALVAVGLAVRPRWRDLPAQLPAASVLVVTSVAATCLVSGLVGWHPLSEAFTSRLLLAAVPCAAVVALRWRKVGTPVTTGQARAGTGCLWMLPGLGMGALSLASVVGRPGLVSGWVFGGDHVRHLAMVVQTYRSGALDYSTQSYPRAWHTLLAALWSSGGATVDGKGFAGLVTIVAVCCWGVFAVISLAVALLAQALARDLGLSHRAGDVAGLVAGTLVLGPPFAGDYLALGFETTSLAGLALVVAALQVVRATGSRVSVLTCAGAVFVVANAWPLLIPGVGVALPITAWPMVRHRPHRVAVVGLVGATLLLGLSLVPVVSAATAFGVASQGAAVGDAALLPAGGWAVAAALAVVAGLVFGMGGRAVVRYSSVVVMTCLVGPALAWYSGVSLTSYYPAKTLWAAGLVGLPWLACLVVAGVTAADSATGVRRLPLVPLAAGAAAVSALSLAAPVLALFGAWSPVDGDAVVQAVGARGAPGAQVFWSGGDWALDATIQSLLPFYSIGPDDYPSAVPRDSLDDQCARLRGADSPTILSPVDPATVRARFSCATDVTVVEVKGWAPKRGNLG